MKWSSAHLLCFIAFVDAFFLFMFSATIIRSYKMSSSFSSAPFAKAVVNAMRKLYALIHSRGSARSPANDTRYPESLADKSFDNTGRQYSNLYVIRVDT